MILIAEFDDICTQLREALEQREKLLEFVKEISTTKWNNEYYARKKANGLLKEIGEE